MGEAKKDEKEEVAFTNKEKKAAYSYTSLLPSCCAAEAISALHSKTSLGTTGIVGIDVDVLRKLLDKQNEILVSGDVSRIESMLLDQAHVLQAMGTFFTMKLSGAEYLNQLEAYSRIALKAQNQCRQTLATLGELKNPKRTTFVKQQNNAVNQQINQDGLKQAENSKKPDNSANKLLGGEPSERLDTRTKEEAIGVNQGVEAVGTINRSKD